MRTPRPPSPGSRGDGSRRRALSTVPLPAASKNVASHPAASRHAVSPRVASLRAARLGPLALAVLVCVAATALPAGTAALAEAPSAPPVDLLDGEVAGAPVCGTPAERLEAAFGMPSHRLEAADGSGAALLRWTHLGLEAEVAPDGSARSLSVRALPSGDLLGWRSTFLGPVASGTRREPVVRLLRGARTRLDSVAEERIEATAAHGRLVVDFAEGWVFAARLACTPAAPVGDVHADARRP